MEKEALAFPGVYRYSLAQHADVRGAFTEFFRAEWMDPEASSMCQANVSVSKPGVVRGLHYHFRQADYWVVVQGKLRAGLVDLRKGSPTHGQAMTLDMGGAGRCGLYIPPGVAHGYQALDSVMLVYLVDNYYDGSDEYGLAWNDPQLGLCWAEAPPPVLSERDRSNPVFSDIPAERLPLFAGG